MPVKSPDGKSEFVACCFYHACSIPKNMVEGEVVIISKMNNTGRELGYKKCEYEVDDPPVPCNHTADYIIERGFPIQN